MNIVVKKMEQSSDAFTIAGKQYRSRLLIGTGKYKDMDETRRAVEASGAEIVTVAIRRTNLGQKKDEPNLLDVLPPATLHHPAQHRRLLQRRGRGAHLPSGAGTAGRAHAREAGSAGR